MPRPQTTFYGVEGAILNALYEISHNSCYDTYDLTQVLNQTVQPTLHGVEPDLQG